MQNVGNTLGVAIIGVVFFGAVHAGYAHALVRSSVVLAGLGLVLAALTRLLPPIGIAQVGTRRARASASAH
jgi:hypothetical protein